MKLEKRVISNTAQIHADSSDCCGVEGNPLDFDAVSDKYVDKTITHKNVTKRVVLKSGLNINLLHVDNR